ncbi:MAG: hypothetical protein GY953_18445 [bacterium]|nr:hypothetical protein [bacterium]
MRPKTQGLLLQLLSVVDGRPVPVKALVDVAGVFEITANNLRVSLARLLAAGLVARDERGQYRLASAGRAVQTHVAEWVRLEDRMVSWKGGWVGDGESFRPGGLQLSDAFQFGRLLCLQVFRQSIFGRG